MVTCSKTYFADEKTAMEYVVRLQATSKRKVVPNRAYLCEKCLNWHITSLSENKLNNLMDQWHKQKLTLEQKNKQLEKKDRKIDSLYEKIADLNGRVDIYRKKCVELEKKMKTYES